MSLYRKPRLESLIQELISKQIEKTIEMNNVLVTVMSVDVDEGHDKTIVNISVFPDDKKKDVLIKLSSQASALAWFLLKKIRIKKIPELIFK